MTRVLLFLTALLLPFSYATAKDDDDEVYVPYVQDYTDQETGKVVINKNGQPMFVHDKDSKVLLKHIISAFNTNTENTHASSVLTQKVNRDSGSVENKWDDIKSGHYFSARLNPPEDLYEDAVVLEEIIVSIAPAPNKNSLGTVMAKLENGEIRAYEVDNARLINLYCLDSAVKYLPAHYKSFTEKYHSPEYLESGIDCSPEADD